jgi:hypothetical protein
MSALTRLRHLTTDEFMELYDDDRDNPVLKDEIERRHRAYRTSLVNAKERLEETLRMGATMLT